MIIRRNLCARCHPAAHIKISPDWFEFGLNRKKSRFHFFPYRFFVCFILFCVFVCIFHFSGHMLNCSIYWAECMFGFCLVLCVFFFIGYQMNSWKKIIDKRFFSFYSAFTHTYCPFNFWSFQSHLSVKHDKKSLIIAPLKRNNNHI